GDKVVTARPKGGYRRTDELRALLPNAQTFADVDNPSVRSTVYELIAPYLTTVARVDKRVVESGEQLPPGGQPGQTGSWVHSRLVPQPRAPIDVNLAPYPVLVAAFTGIGFGGAPGQPATEVDFDTAKTLAQAVITYRQSPTISVDTTGTPIAAGYPESRRY